MSSKIPVHVREQQTAPTAAHKPCPFCGARPRTKYMAGVYCGVQACPLFKRLFTAPKWNTRAPAQS